MPNLLVLFLAAAVIALLFWVKAKNRTLHFVLVGLSVLFLFTDYIITPSQDKTYTLILLLVLFGNAFQKFKKAV
jgi:uncharacterized membrane protein YbjE (DUF340 family)